LKILIAGSRNFRDRKLVEDWLEMNFFKSEDTMINGNCKDGPDAWALSEAHLYDWKVELYNPNWEKYGKAAGPIRNEEMVKVADKVVCFWDGQSKGTYSTIEYALKYKKDLEVIF
jgi:hypothetical protein